MVTAARNVITLLKDSFTAWVNDYAPSMGAALAYYTVFSVAPLLLIVISVAGLVFGQDAARGELFEQLRELVGERSAAAIQALLTTVKEPGEGIIATVIGVIVVIIGATTVFAELQNSLDRIWRAPERPKGSGLWSLLRTRLFAFGIVLGIGFLLIVSLVLSAGLAALGRWWAPVLGGWQVLAETLNTLLTFGLITTAFALIYKLIPRVDVAWRDVMIGAVVTAALFALGKFLIGYYIGKSGVASGFGAAGSLVVILVWVYYSAQIFFFGAEFTWVYAHRHGSRRHKTKDMDTKLRTPAAEDEKAERQRPRPRVQH